jgi:hypothetical protein
MLTLGSKSMPRLKKENIPSNAIAMNITAIVIGRRILVELIDTTCISPAIFIDLYYI